MGDEYNLLVETFVNDSSQRLKTIAEAVASGDPEAIRRSTHSFKGSAANMGAIRLSQICKTLEELGASGEVNGTEQLLADLQQEYLMVASALAEV
jgi:HPt (histidine-containing phosphotransfer) domain-containing protein